ncbi:fungal-specific transcription factor domain-containing protein [Annulohypoxylon maeteangense]|uniref:fungal-specific transcription factor domain-containing protein n=1 Tax=Annulohypoxylon maeteangense TaxID=1927788 RepID=UPI002007977A|nr:fungal-specific transcription factor domain-containing protein [Annulohypoxylon maeteangense]KAI0886964.1 fungal-specific transcription factor domain-containing protein [Annulohypoxylon maeteangense]
MAQTHGTELGSTNGVNELNVPRRKRLKVSVACNPCRSRKIKCDGGRPGQYFGSSSAGSFTSQIRTAIDARLGVTTSHGTCHPISQTFTPFRNRIEHAREIPEIVNYVLPPRRQADQLLEIYWRYVDPLYPFLDKENFESSYRCLFNGTPLQVDERIFMATLNIILALSTQVQETSGTEHREQASKAFFDRAQNLLRLDIWDAGSIELIQYLLILSQYLQSTNNPHQTWMVVGTVVRIAQGLGLHLPETSMVVIDIKTRELLRQLWHGCVLMDRMISVTHGRPTMISGHLASAVPLPQDPQTILANDTDGEQSVRIKPRNRLAFFVNSVELYEIINQIIVTLYTTKPTVNRSRSSSHSGPCHRIADDLAAALNLDESLNTMEKEIPPELKITSPDVSKDTTLHRQAVIIHIRILHARMLLLRPMLAQFCLSQSSKERVSTNKTLLSRTMEQCALACVDSAHKMIEIIYEHQKSDDSIGLLPSWWYRVFYVYTAATVLLAARLRRETFATSSISDPWNKAMSILRSHERFGISARRCGAALQILSSKVMNEPNDVGSSGASTGARAFPNQTFSPNEAFDMHFHEPINPTDFDINSFDFDVDNYQWLNSMPSGILY